MRKTITALAVCAALSVFGFAGVADAAGHHNPTPPSCTPAAGSTTCTPTVPGHPLPPCTITGTETSCSDPLPPHPFPGHPLPPASGVVAGLPGLIGGTYLNVTALGLPGVANVDVCAYPTWDAFNGHFGGVYGNRFDSVRQHFGGNAPVEWLHYRQVANCGTTTVVQNSLPTLVNVNVLDLSRYGLSGQTQVCQYPTWDNFQTVYAPRFGSRFDGLRDYFGRDAIAQRAAWNQLRLRARCQPSTTVIVAPSSDNSVTNNSTTVEAAPLAPATVTQTAPAPVYSAPVPNTSSGIDTGDGSVPLAQW